VTVGGQMHSQSGPTTRTESAALPLPVVERALTGPELMPWWTDHAAPVHVGSTLQLEGPITERALRAALDAWQARHSLLRVRIVPVGKLDARFEALKSVSVPLAIQELPETELARAIEAEISQRVDWKQGPLCRARWIRHSASSHHIVLTYSHVISDGRTVIVLAHIQLSCRVQRASSCK
jgi:hypothetical protein